MVNRRNVLLGVVAAPAAAIVPQAAKAVGPSEPTPIGSPLILSVRSGEPGHDTFCALHADGFNDIVVRLNGKPVKYANAVNGHEGWVRVYRLSPNGDLMYSRDSGECLEETLYGDIEVLIENIRLDDKNFRSWDWAKAV